MIKKILLTIILIVCLWLIWNEQSIHFYDIRSIITFGWAFYFWVLSITIYSVVFFVLSFSKKKITNSINVRFLFEVLLGLSLWILISIEVLKIINVPKVGSAQEIVMVEGTIEAMVVERCTRTSKCKLLKIKKIDGEIVERRVSEHLYGKSFVGGKIKIKYWLGLLGIPYQYGDFDNGEVSELR